MAAVLYLATTGVLALLHATYGQTLVGALMLLQDSDAAFLFPTIRYLGVTRTAIYLIGTVAAVWPLLQEKVRTQQNN